MENQSNGLAIAALVCGILGVLGAILPFPLIVKAITFVLAIIGIVLGVKGKKKAMETNSGKGLATAGLVLGIIGTAFGAVGVLCAIACVASTASLVNSINSLY